MKVPEHISFPTEASFDSDLALFTYRPSGVIDEGSVNRVIRVLGDLEAALKEPFNRFTDTLEADAIDLNFRFILHVSLFRRLSYSSRPPINSAILATDDTAIHYARLHALLTQGSPIKVRIFQDREKAAAWLAVPVDRLRPALQEEMPKD